MKLILCGWVNLLSCIVWRNNPTSAADLTQITVLVGKRTTHYVIAAPIQIITFSVKYDQEAYSHVTQPSFVLCLSSLLSLTLY